MDSTSAPTAEREWTVKKMYDKYDELIRALRENASLYIPSAYGRMLNYAADTIEELWQMFHSAEMDNVRLTNMYAEQVHKHKWIPVEMGLPDEGQEVLVAGEMKYEWETSLERFVDIGMLQDREPYRPDMPTDVLKWSTINDWYEGQDTYRITHWLPIPKHPKEKDDA